MGFLCGRVTAWDVEEHELTGVFCACRERRSRGRSVRPATSSARRGQARECAKSLSRRLGSPSSRARRRSTAAARSSRCTRLDPGSKATRRTGRLHSFPIPPSTPPLPSFFPSFSLVSPILYLDPRLYIPLTHPSRQSVGPPSKPPFGPPLHPPPPSLPLLPLMVPPFVPYSFFFW